jgi:sorbitol-6-phosphate 2-dehydrogenase
MNDQSALDGLVAELSPTLRGLTARDGRLPLVRFAAGDVVAGAGAVVLEVDAVANLDASLAKVTGAVGPDTTQVVVPGVGTFTVDHRLPRPGRVSGRLAVVTGAAQGFGLAISEGLIAQGACVVLADLNDRLATAEADRLRDRYGDGTAVAIGMDVTDESSVVGGVAEILRSYGGLDLLVSNAGVLRAGSVTTQPVADFDLVTRVNYRGYFLMVKHIAPVMARQHAANPAWWGDIIEINSKSGLAGSSRNSAYAGSKFGGIGLTQSFALELVSDGIKVNAVCPGNFLDGPLWSDPDNGLFVQYLREGKVPGATTVDDVRRAYEAKVPMGRGCTPGDVLEALLYVVAQQYETGQALPVTGGQVMLS